MFSTHALHKLQRHGLAVVHADLKLDRLSVRVRNALVRALQKGYYPAANGNGVLLYEGLMQGANLPYMWVCKSRWYWSVFAAAFPDEASAAVKRLMELDKVATEVSGKPYNSYQNNFAQGNGCFTLRKLTFVEQLADVAATYANTPAYQGSVERLIHAVKFGQTVKVQ